MERKLNRISKIEDIGWIEDKRVRSLYSRWLRERDPVRKTEVGRRLVITLSKMGYEVSNSVYWRLEGYG